MAIKDSLTPTQLKRLLETQNLITIAKNYGVTKQYISQLYAEYKAQYPDLFAEIVRRGHSTGCHSYSHVQGWGVPLDDYVQDVDIAAELIRTNLYRPPYAKITVRQADALSLRYNIVMWNILSRDYNRKLGHRACARNVVPYLRAGSITVFHDSMKASKNLWYALPKTLEAVNKLELKCKPIIL